MREPSEAFCCHVLLLKQCMGLCRNPGNFTQGKQTCSVANTASIINSPALSFPNVTIAPSRLKHSQQPAAALWDTLPVNQETHTPLTVGASGPAWLYEPVRKGITEDTDHWIHEVSVGSFFYLLFSRVEYLKCPGLFFVCLFLLIVFVLETLKTFLKTRTMRRP